MFRRCWRCVRVVLWHYSHRTLIVTQFRLRRQSKQVLRARQLCTHLFRVTHEKMQWRDEELAFGLWAEFLWMSLKSRVQSFHVYSKLNKRVKFLVHQFEVAELKACVYSYKWQRSSEITHDWLSNVHATTVFLEISVRSSLARLKFCGCSLASEFRYLYVLPVT